MKIKTITALLLIAAILTISVSPAMADLDDDNGDGVTLRYDWIVDDEGNLVPPQDPTICDGCDGPCA